MLDACKSAYQTATINYHTVGEIEEQMEIALTEIMGASDFLVLKENIGGQ